MSLSAFEAMSAGELYDAGDPELVTMRKRAQALMRDYNATIYGEDAARARILPELRFIPVLAAQ